MNIIRNSMDELNIVSFKHRLDYQETSEVDKVHIVGPIHDAPSPGNIFNFSTQSDSTPQPPWRPTQQSGSLFHQGLLELPVSLASALKPSMHALWLCSQPTLRSP